MFVLSRLYRGGPMLGAAVITTGAIAVAPVAAPLALPVAPTVSADVELTALGDDGAGGLIPGLGGLGGLLGGFDPVDLLVQNKALIQSTVDLLSDTAKWLADPVNASTIDWADSALADSGVTGLGDWLGAEAALIPVLLDGGVDGDDFSGLFNPIAAFDLSDLGWALGWLGIDEGDVGSVGELLGVASQLLSGTVNVAILALGELNAALAGGVDEEGLAGLMESLQPLLDSYMTEAQPLLEELMTGVQDLDLFGLGDFAGFDFSDIDLDSLWPF